MFSIVFYLLCVFNFISDGRTNERREKEESIINHKLLARDLQDHYKSCGARTKITLNEIVDDGETFIFNVRIKKGTNKLIIKKRAGDIQTALQLARLRPFEEDNSIYLSVSEIPSTEVSLVKMLKNPYFYTKGRLPVALGHDMRGIPFYADIVDFPHGMYGGTTVSGKSTGLRNLILSIAAKQPMNKANIIIIDTLVSGFNHFQSLPHLSCPIIEDTSVAVNALAALVNEFELRAKMTPSEKKSLPAIVLIIDEYLHMIENANPSEKKIIIDILTTLFRSGRHSKIHVTLATHEATKQDMQIKLTNVNTRMAFRCTNHHASKSILGESGADRLHGKGAMLFKSPLHPIPIDLQGSFISLSDTEQLIRNINSKEHDKSKKFVIDSKSLTPPIYQIKHSSGSDQVSESRKELADIIIWSLSRVQISKKQIKDEFKMGNRVNEIMIELLRMNIVTDKDSNKPRDVIVKEISDLPEEVMNILKKSGFTEEQICETLKSKEN
jgi:S-DNA-T family DNA segregation ATPase FtsK/SpoIIIE